MQQAQQAPLALTAHKVCKASKGSRVFKAKLARPEQLALKVPLALAARRDRRATSDLWVYKARREFRVRPVLPAHQAHKGRRAM